MTGEPTTPEPDPQDEREVHRSLTGDIIIATSAALSGPLGVLTDHLLEGGNEEPPPPEIELPPGVNQDG
jgi:hypothetical protein